jgi:sulfonate transport system ATP-binding protein
MKTELTNTQKSSEAVRRLNALKLELEDDWSTVVSVQWGETPRQATSPQTLLPGTTNINTESNSPPAIELLGLSKSFGSRQVLRNLDLTIKKGEFVAIIGRSGCGKSTLLRLLGGLERPDAGQNQLAHIDHELTIRMMFQEPRLLPWKTVQENVALGLGRTHTNKDIVQKTLAKVGLAERANEWPARLSGGQKQRIALARALVHQPDLLLLDEPLGALDALTRIEMQSLIEELWQQQGFTAVLVTHDVQEAISLADRIVLIEDGRITLNESINFPRPRTRGAAAFAQLEERILRQVLRQTN